ncbi:plasmid stabilization protein [Nostoc sp. T09]|uniref:type II toxin-antitoxin system RelE/ParE family toxin n=1 Tax=Nostoc sp. T09 TaxID=1932621 RepID=UPI000A3D28ED|nr:type II toxin-antitoxin system RelE/ParE family toxin [Nostoc sp. T09]OUL30710.1 plasmid stabilization protein [Nostoc sp. T09]
MNRRYVINILATQDLKEIADYFTANSIEAGEQFFHKFDRRCEQLINFSNMGRSYAEIYPNLRGLLLDGYIIFYRVLDDGIEILRVVNARRDLPSIFEDQ